MLSFPFAPAEKYAFPGGYPIGYLMDDGEFLCADCINNSDNPVHFGGEPDGWRFEGLQVLDDPEIIERCAHCSVAIV